jgi:hypothetical protein
MAVTAKYTKAFSIACTETQLGWLDDEAERTSTSRADVARRAIDSRYGLVDGLGPAEEFGGQEGQE